MKDLFESVHSILNHLYGLSLCIGNSVVLWWAAELASKTTLYSCGSVLSYALPAFLKVMSVVSAVWGICSFLSH